MKMSLIVDSQISWTDQEDITMNDIVIGKPIDTELASLVVLCDPNTGMWKVYTVGGFSEPLAYNSIHEIRSSYRSFKFYKVDLE